MNKPLPTEWLEILRFIVRRTHATDTATEPGLRRF